jgi:hypothetical protein
LQWLDNGAWILCRLYDHIVGHILGLTTWKQKPSKDQLAALAAGSFEKSDLYKKMTLADQPTAVKMLKDAIIAGGATVVKIEGTTDSDTGYKLTFPTTTTDLAPHVDFFGSLIPLGVDATVTDTAQEWHLDTTEQTTILNSNDAIKFFKFSHKGMQSFTEDTTAMALLYTSLVTSTFLGFVGARKRFLMIPAASVAVSVWLHGSRTVPGQEGKGKGDKGWFKSFRELGKDLQPTEVMILIILIKSALGALGHVASGGSARDAASKATFRMTHEFEGDLQRRQDSRRMHEESVARLAAHPAATLFKTGAEFLGYNNIGY